MIFMYSLVQQVLVLEEDHPEDDVDGMVVIAMMTLMMNMMIIYR